jgi:polyhydroxyalkanoate synthesis regulator phasin
MAIRQSLQSPAKAKAPVGRPPKGTSKPKTPRNPKPGIAKAPATTGASSDIVDALKKQLEIQQQALDTQAWMAQEISSLRQQLAQKSADGSSDDDIALRTEIAILRQENADLAEKAHRLNQMASLFNGAAVTATTTPAKKGRKPGTSKSPTPAALHRSSQGSLWKAAADSDLNRTYKSCWPVVFKIEEWNQRNPSKLAKISQTMLNKSGVNFSRARGFVDAYAAELRQYHNQIGLTKANSGKFNEVYEFIRTSLGKGRRG